MNLKLVTKKLHHFADLLELSGENSFRVGAYRRAARALENSKRSLSDLRGRFSEIPGIGKGTAAVIEEIIDTGTCQSLEERKQALPPGLLELLELSGVGPKTIYTLYQALDITNIHQLKQAAEQKKIRQLKGFGAKKEQKILEAISDYQQRPKRVLWAEAQLLGDVLLQQLRALHPFVEKAELAGSLRRKKETIKDIDLLVATRHPIFLSEKLETFPEVTKIIQSGETKVNLLAKHEDVQLSVDIRFVRSESFASALHHFTGSTEHNIRIRQIAKKLGYKVNEYGIEDQETGDRFTFSTEADFFAKLQLPYIQPELREDRGEIEAAKDGRLPHMISADQILGDLHTHSLYSDGIHSILEMAKAAQKKGYQYLAITDHSRSLKVASGLSIEELKEQWAEIDQLNQQFSHFEILKGAEVDILPDGTLDYPDEILAQMDIVIASIHTSFHLGQNQMTKRLIQAMKNPYVHIIGHPTGRLLLRRDAYNLDLDRIFQVAKETGTILELNANPHRLDLNDLLLKKAKEEYQLKFCINTDAHSTEQLHNLLFGIHTARRGWLTREDILNAQPWEQGKKWLKKPPSK